MKTLTILLVILAGSAIALMQSVNPVTYWAFQIASFALVGYASYATFRATLKYFNSK